MRFLFYMAFGFFYFGELGIALLIVVFLFVLYDIVTTSLWEWGLVCVLLSRLFLCLACIAFCLFSLLVTGVGYGL